mmetsp:Transcript_61093/g.108980  ORF Transcript_61093/g.108980 Transcript_61093/m.108980 type:complete len:88 (+) Transcript_61093:865-1128(+)
MEPFLSFGWLTQAKAEGEPCGGNVEVKHRPRRTARTETPAQGQVHTEAIFVSSADGVGACVTPGQLLPVSASPSALVPQARTVLKAF